MLESFDLQFARLPACAEGLRIAHLSDTHIHRFRGYDATVEQLANRRVNLILLTGDYMVRGGDPKPALDYLRYLTQQLHPRHGFAGVFGNHDEPTLREQARTLPIRWVGGDAIRLPDAGLELFGVDTPIGPASGGCDVTPAAMRLGAMLRSDATQPPAEKLLRVALCHLPSALPQVAELRPHWMLAGHTHGGQIRLPGKWTPLSFGFDCHHPAGVFRYRSTVMTVSRGLGQRPGLPRIHCPRQAPVYTLRRGPAMGVETQAITNVAKW